MSLKTTISTFAQGRWVARELGRLPTMLVEEFGRRRWLHVPMRRLVGSKNDLRRDTCDSHMLGF